MRRVVVVLTLAALIAVPACSDKGSTKSTSTGGTSATNSTGSTGSSGTTNPDDPFEWEDFGDTGQVQTGHLIVPVDYDDPSLGTFDLFVARHLADPEQRIGSLLVNPGGPGFGGSDFAIYADQVYSADLLARFDIIGWDPRGTGLSEPAIDCVDDYDHFYAELDITPDDDAERQAIIDTAKEFADACVAENADIIQHIGTNDSARDMNALREALGEDKISYFGFSYGSELGAAWVTMFPDTVRAAVLDGAVDPTADFAEQGLQQSKGFEDSLQAFLDQCASDATCAFHNDGDPAGAFDALMIALDANPAATSGGRPPVNLQVLSTAVAEAMYSETSWPALAQALADAQEGKGDGLLALYDEYFGRGEDGSYDDSLEAFQVIACMDTADRLTVEQEDGLTQQFLDVAPRIAPGTTGSYFCTFFPVTEDARVEITGKGAGPVLVMGTTGDPATPLEGTRVMAQSLEDGRLVIVEGQQHTGYWVSDCSTSVVDQYLIDPSANNPADGTRGGLGTATKAHPDERRSRHGQQDGQRSHPRCRCPRSRELGGGPL